MLASFLRVMSARKFNPLPRTIRGPVSLALAGIIREERERRGWTLGELARRSGLTRHGLFLAENRNGALLTETVERIARAFGMLYSQLVQLAEDRVAQWLPECADCNYSCIEFGQLKHLDSNRGCTRLTP